MFKDTVALAGANTEDINPDQQQHFDRDGDAPSRFVDYSRDRIEPRYLPAREDEPQIPPSDGGSGHRDRAVRHSVESHSSWTSRGPSDRSSPSDQLVAAILEGDVQGIRTIVRSKGDTLHSPFWAEIAKSILPLHRAISGLHFHGSEGLLVSTVDALIQLGCNVKSVDHAGNTAVHKALQVCTSANVCAVLKALLSKGASAVARTNFGDAPIHTECRRYCLIVFLSLNVSFLLLRLFQAQSGLTRGYISAPPVWSQCISALRGQF
jgi:hypothetical protein